jgi:hypothetical protein
MICLGVGTGAKFAALAGFAGDGFQGQYAPWKSTADVLHALRVQKSCQISTTLQHQLRERTFRCRAQVPSRACSGLALL